MAAARAAAQLAEQGEGRCALSGALTMETAPWLWRELQQAGLLASAVEADLSGVSASDSAGLALLVTWRASRRQAGGELTFTAVPARLRALAELTGAGALLDAAAANA
jgi:phospholipid transport system transporter-binding protein